MGIAIPFKKKKPHKTREGQIALTLAMHDIDLVIDIGANNGQTHGYLRKGGYKGEIISIDPLPSLQENLQTMAKKDPLWRVLPPLAIGDKDGECELNVSEASDMSSVLEATNDLMQALPRTRVENKITVPMKTLGTLYNDLDLEGRNVFVKMDTQGLEMTILKAATDIFPKISGFQLEMSLFELYEGETLMLEIMNFLDKHGFKPHMIVENNFSRRINRQLQVDGLFFKD